MNSLEAEQDESAKISTKTNQSFAVSVVIVTYNSAEFLNLCVEELHRSKDIDLEIIVVDNDSEDETHEIAKELREKNVIDQYLPKTENLGCAGGNNIGWHAAKNPLILMLNADCVVQPHTIKNMANELAENAQTGCVGALLFYPNSRKIQHAGAEIYPNGIANHYGRNSEFSDEFQQRRTVDFVTGACLMYRKTDMEELGGFDEDYYPAYYEEADFCARLRSKGLQTVYLPNAIGYHHEMVTTGKESPKFIQMATNARIKFLIKNRSLPELFTKVLWKEWKWFWNKNSAGTRYFLLRAYVNGLLFAVITIIRFRKRNLVSQENT